MFTTNNKTTVLLTFRYDPLYNSTPMKITHLRLSVKATTPVCGIGYLQLHTKIILPAND